MLQGRETIDKSDESSSKRQSLVEPFDEKCEMKLAVKVGIERNLNFTDWYFVSSWTDQTLKAKIAEEEEGEKQGTTKALQARTC